VSFLGKLWGGTKKVADVAAKVATNPLFDAGLSLIPGAGPFAVLANRAGTLVLDAEAKFKDVPGKNGPQKQALVIAGLQDFMDLFNLVAPDGHEVHYDQDQLKAMIDAQVAAFNAVEAFRKTINIGPVQ